MIICICDANSTVTIYAQKTIFESENFGYNEWSPAEIGMIVPDCRNTCKALWKMENRASYMSAVHMTLFSSPGLT